MAGGTILKVNGPPGTGKTKFLMEVIKVNTLKRGIDPSKIAFGSFTKAAVSEAKQRTEDLLNISEEELPYFGTLHSLCYRHLGLSRKRIITNIKFKEFCHEHGYTYDDREIENILFDDTPIFDPGNYRKGNEGAALMSFSSWRRAGMMELNEAYSKFYPADPLSWFSKYRIEEFEKQYALWKIINDLVDFEDMIQKTIQTGWHPAVDMLMIDEAQDLSKSQQHLVDQWIEKIQVTWIAGDEDQTIYGFQHANPQWMLNLPGEGWLLSKSFRVPRIIHERSVRVIERNQNRMKNKKWMPRDEEGSYLEVSPSKIAYEIEDRPGSWFLLSRNRYYLNHYVTILIEKGIPFKNERGYSPLNRIPISIRAAFKIASRIRISIYELVHLAREIPQGDWWEWGAKARLEDLYDRGDIRKFELTDLAALGAKPELLRQLSSLYTALDPLLKLVLKKSINQYYIKIIRKYGIDGLTCPPRVTLSTIHGSKGREVDHVALVDSMPRQIFHNYLNDPESERRVLYVGMTRARKSLSIIRHEQGYPYDEIR